MTNSNALLQTQQLPLTASSTNDYAIASSSVERSAPIISGGNSTSLVKKLIQKGEIAALGTQQINLYSTSGKKFFNAG